MIKNKARLVAQGYTQEEGIDYDEVFALVTIIEAIRLILAYASFKDFVVYQMDVKSAFLYGLQVKQKEYGIFISQDKYVTEILKKFGFTNVKIASTPMETQKALLKDENGEEVDVHLYRSMIGSLMYLTSSRPDIMFAVCACARYQVNPKVSHLHTMKRIFRHLKGQPKLGLWYPKDSPFDLVAYTDSENARASLDMKSIIGDSNEKKLIQMIKIHTDKNVADLLTKAFDALTVNSTIYTSCIEHFWSTAKAKTVNGEVQLQTLVDGKKIIITEATIRRDLQLEDANGVDCLSNATIFEQLTLIGYEKLSQKLTFYKAFFSPQWKFLIHTILQCLSAKTTAWNEFSSTMASAIICLATNQKFNFSKYIFDSMVKNVENVNKFLMYPRFVQVFVNQQVGDMSNHKRIYVTPSHTKKVFGNMKREGKGFSGRVTPLFLTMVVQAQKEMGEDLASLTDPHHTPIITQPSTSQPHKKQKPRKPKRKDTKAPQPSGPTTNVADEAFTEENVTKHSNDPLLSGEDSMKLEELMELCTNLQQRVIDMETTQTTQGSEIASLKRRVKKLEKKNKSRTRNLKRLYKIGRSARIVSSHEASLGDQEDASKQERKIDDIDADAEITLVDETQGRHDDDMMFDTCVLNDEEVFVGQDMAEKEVSTADPITTAGEVVTTANVEVSTASPTAATITIVELTLAQTLAELKSARPKTKGVVMQEPSESVTTITIPSKDKGKGIMEERIAREKEEVNAALIAQWNDIQDKVETDYKLAQRLQAEEQEELTIEEKSKLFQQLLEKMRKHFTAKRAKERRNRPPTKA
ncbi:putative ribonuclease H-like domain-containing protein [Tanacetum coccineum]